jgi:hypothetical protein
MSDVIIAKIGHCLERVLQRHPHAQQYLKCTLQRRALIRRKPCAAKTHHIESTYGGRIAVGYEEWKHILHDLGLTANHRVSTHPYKLMSANIARQKDVILHHYVTRECRSIREDIVISNQTVVRNMHPDHEKVPRAYPCGLPFSTGAVNGRMLADEIIVADFEKAWLSPEFDVLRFTSEHRMFENAVSLSQGGGTLHDGMRAEFGT